MRYFLRCLPLLMLSGFGACNSGNRDPVADAKFQNEQRIGNEDITKRQQQDAAFLVEAATDSQLQIELGKLAQTKALSPDLRGLGQQLVRDHGELTTALRTLASRKGIVLPEALGGKQQESYQQLAGLTGVEFDQKYLELVVDHHDDSEDAFDDMVKDAYDGDIRAFAAKYVPTLKNHYDRAEQLKDALKK